MTTTEAQEKIYLYDYRNTVPVPYSNVASSDETGIRNFYLASMVVSMYHVKCIPTAFARTVQGQKNDVILGSARQCAE